MSLSNSDIDLPFKDIDYDGRKYAASLRGKVIIIEGTISAGKSTLTEEIVKFAWNHNIKVKYFAEPLMPSLLNLFLNNQRTYAFAFQLSMLTKRQAIYRNAQKAVRKGYLCIIDRSIHGDYCFALMHRKNGNINDEEWKVYLSELNSEKFEAPDYVLYLDVSPKEAIRRSIIRNRDGEDKYDLTYFENLSNVYNSVIPQSPSKNYIHIDWNTPRQREEIIKPILDTILLAYNSH